MQKCLSKEDSIRLMSPDGCLKTSNGTGLGNAPTVPGDELHCNGGGSFGSATLTFGVMEKNWMLDLGSCFLQRTYHAFGKDYIWAFLGWYVA